MGEACAALNFKEDNVVTKSDPEGVSITHLGQQLSPDCKGGNEGIGLANDTGGKVGVGKGEGICPRGGDSCFEGDAKGKGGITGLVGQVGFSKEKDFAVSEWPD